MKILLNFKPLNNGTFKFEQIKIGKDKVISADEPVCIYDTNKDYGENPKYISLPNSAIYEIITKEEYDEISKILKKENIEIIEEAK